MHNLAPAPRTSLQQGSDPAFLASLRTFALLRKVGGAAPLCCCGGGCRWHRWRCTVVQRHSGLAAGAVRGYRELAVWLAAGCHGLPRAQPQCASSCPSPAHAQVGAVRKAVQSGAIVAGNAGVPIVEVQVRLPGGRVVCGGTCGGTGSTGPCVL